MAKKGGGQPAPKVNTNKAARIDANRALRQNRHAQEVAKAKAKWERRLKARKPARGDARADGRWSLARQHSSSRATGGTDVVR